MVEKKINYKWNSKMDVHTYITKNKQQLFFKFDFWNIELG